MTISTSLKRIFCPTSTLALQRNLTNIEKKLKNITQKLSSASNTSSNPGSPKVILNKSTKKTLGTLKSKLVKIDVSLDIKSKKPKNTVKLDTMKEQSAQLHVKINQLLNPRPVQFPKNQLNQETSRNNNLRTELEAELKKINNELTPFYDYLNSLNFEIKVLAEEMTSLKKSIPLSDLQNSTEMNKKIEELKSKMKELDSFEEIRSSRKFKAKVKIRSDLISQIRKLAINEYNSLNEKVEGKTIKKINFNEKNEECPIPTMVKGDSVYMNVPGEENKLDF